MRERMGMTATLYQRPVSRTLDRGFPSERFVIHRGEQRRFAMAAPIRLREDFDGAQLRSLAKASKDAKQTRRLLALAVIYDGGSRSEAATTGGVGLQVIRDWVLRFNAEGAAGLLDRKAPGAVPRLNDEQRHALAEIVESGPIPAIHGVVRWRRKDLVRWLYEEFGVEVAETTVGRELRAMGFRRLTARPRHHSQNELALEAFKKLPRGAGGAPGAPTSGYANRDLVAGRSAHRPEEQDHPALGAVRHQAQRSPGPAHQVSLHLAAFGVR